MKKIIILCLPLIFIINGCFVKKADTAILVIKGAEEDQELLDAIIAEDLEKLIEALMKGADPNTEICDKKVIHIAVKKGNLAIVKELVNKGADIKSETALGKTVLHLACRLGYEDLVKYILTLFDQNDIEIKNKNTERTALMVASEKGHVAVVELLLNKGANIEAKDEYGSRALSLASSKGHTNIVELLLRSGANIEALDVYGFTALHEAALHGHKEIVELFLRSGVNVHAANKFGETALHIASTKGHANVVELLLKSGVNIHLANNYGETAFHMASTGGHSNVIELLLNEGINIETVNKYGETALHVASTGGYANVVELLLNKGANTKAVNKKGETALHISSAGGQQSSVILLSDKGYTNLHLASMFDDVKVIKLLYKHLANINFKNTLGKTPIGLLYWSAIQKDWAAVQKIGHRPLFISIINHELKILRKLLQRKINKLSIKLKTELEKLDKTSLSTAESIKALTMTLKYDDLIKNEIFKDVLEMSPLYSYILKNPGLVIDERIFEIKCEKEIIEGFTSEDIIELFIKM